MKGLNLHAVQDLRLEELPKPVPTGDELLIKVGACGICGSDIPRVYQLGTKVYPVVLGHEFSGEVIEVGNKKDRDLIGKKAAIFPLIPCRNCDPCEIGNYCQCQNYGYLGSRNNGGFEEYCLVPSRWHLVLAEDSAVDLDLLALTEPASVAQHANRRGKVTAGQTVVIIGAGPIGLLTARWAKIFGANQVLLTEINEAKKSFAGKRGFHVINSAKENIKKKIGDLTNGRGADVVIEGTGSSGGVNDALKICRVGGTVVWMGNPADDVTIQLDNYSLFLRKELNMFGIWNSAYSNTPINEWAYTVKMIENKMLKVDDLITHRAGIKDILSLFDGIHNGQITPCKAMYSAKLNG